MPIIKSIKKRKLKTYRGWFRHGSEQKWRVFSETQIAHVYQKGKKKGIAVIRFPDVKSEIKLEDMIPITNGGGGDEETEETE